MFAIAGKSTPALRRAEKAAFRAMTATFNTMLMLDKQGCDAATYLQVNALYRQQADEHGALCAELAARHDAIMAERHEEEMIGIAMQADRSDYLWDSAVAD